MAAPILNESMETAGVYFPKGAWMDLRDGRRIQAEVDKARVRIIHSPMNGTMPIFLRNGYIIPTQ